MHRDTSLDVILKGLRRNTWEIKEQPYQSTNYHLSWLEIALNHFKQQSKEVHSVNSDMTMGEFIKKWAGEELSKVIKLD
jgi:hypothetical protein